MRETFNAWFWRAVSYLAIGPACRLRHAGRGRIPAGGSVIASNHQSFLDPILVGLAAGRPTAFMARDTLFRNPLFGAWIGSLRAFPVRRGVADRAAIRRAVDRIRGGMPVVVFPEGTRGTDGDPAPARGGFLLIARQADCPVVPARVEGAHRAWPRGRSLPHPSPIRVVFGEPFPCTLPPDEASARLKDFWKGMPGNAD